MTKQLLDISNYIMWFTGDVGSLITNLKLQKLVYYAQAWHLALYDKPLYEDDIQAWVHGPAVHGLYRKFSKYGWQPIQPPTEKPELPEAVEEFMNELLDVYLPLEAYQLEKMTHNEDPWKMARGGIPIDESSNAVIDHNSMKIYYRKLADESSTED